MAPRRSRSDPQAKARTESENTAVEQSQLRKHGELLDAQPTDGLGSAPAAVRPPAPPRGGPHMEQRACKTATVIIVLPLAIGVIAVIYAVKQRQLINAAWTSAATQLGLTARIGSIFTTPEISGVVDGLSVSVKVRSSGGDNSSNYTRYKVRHLPAGPPVVLKRQNSFSRFSRFFGKTDVEIGDPFFDDRVFVESPSPTAIREFLTPARQAVVLEVFDRWKNGEVRHDAIIAESYKIEPSGAALVSNVRRLLDMAAVMGDAEPLNQVLSRQQDGDLAGAAVDLHALNEQRPNSFTEVLEAEALVELGDHEAAAQIFGSVEARIPATADAGGWEALASKPAPVQLPAAPRAKAQAPTQQVVIDDLFDSGRLSFEIVDHFEQTYANTTVNWAGTVTRVNNFRHDSDFGAGPGQKVTVLLGGSGRSEMISNEVHAVVQFGSDAELRRDTEIPFTGTLIRVDRFARKLYVAEAVLK